MRQKMVKTVVNIENLRFYTIKNGFHGLRFFEKSLIYST